MYLQPGYWPEKREPFQESIYPMRCQKFPGYTGHVPGYHLSEESKYLQRHPLPTRHSNLPQCDVNTPHTFQHANYSPAILQCDYTTSYSTPPITECNNATSSSPQVLQSVQLCSYNIPALPPQEKVNPSKRSKPNVQAPALMASLRDAPEKTTKVNANFVRNAIQTAGGAVVSIGTRRILERSMPNEADIFSFFFFGGPSADAPKRGMKRREIVQGAGSGFCVDPSGVILTNSHVVADADEITVTFPNGQEYTGNVVASDPLVDVAVLQLEDGSGRRLTQLPTVKLGCSQHVQVGDWAIAVGAPLGLSNTVTCGIVSSLNRSIGQQGGCWDWMNTSHMQTDAAINQGNSGGPLLDQEGRAIAMITARAMMAEAIGFAVPVDTVKRILPMLLKGEVTPHAFLGIKMTSLTRDVFLSRNKDPSFGRLVADSPAGGALVDATLRGSPASLAGVRKGDVIVHLSIPRNQQGAAQSLKVSRREDVQQAVLKALPGDYIELTIRRGPKQEVNLKIKLADTKDIAGLQQKAEDEDAAKINGGGTQRFFFIG